MVDRIKRGEDPVPPAPRACVDGPVRAIRGAYRLGANHGVLSGIDDEGEMNPVPILLSEPPTAPKRTNKK